MLVTVFKMLLSTMKISYKNKFLTLLAHVQHQNFSCNVSIPCHHEQRLFLCYQRFQWHTLLLPKKYVRVKEKKKYFELIKITISTSG